MSNFIEATKLCKSYNNNLALDNVSFSVQKGELYGFIGADGAGKTTLFEIMTTLLLPDKGRAHIGDWDVIKDYVKIRSHIGYMPGKFSLYQDLTVQENLQFFAKVFHTTIKENYFMIESIYKLLEPFAGRKAGDLSGGMKQKLALCCALIRNPKVLFLDEPTTGVDPVSRTDFWENLQEIKKRGITIIVSTPYMDEAVQCDRVALIHNGKLMKINTPENIIDQFEKKIISIKTSNKFMLLETLRKYSNYEAVYAFGENIHFVINNETAINQKAELQKYLDQNFQNDFSLQFSTPEFEDCFLNFMRNEDHSPLKGGKTTEVGSGVWSNRGLSSND